ncbi:MAG: 2,4-dihydroxyhept-2-ene-1,7-dioic acid aldolase [Desulfobacteraceae bacterium]|nr:2,4-dihydroxyhept-2-ene-1,7-dioic acid aldolase [Desulfobacteraceae bacterium]
MPFDLKTRLKNKETLIGSLVTLGSADVAELMSFVGFDYLWIDAEHAPLDFAQIQRMIQAVGGRCPCIVRVPENREVWIKKALDTGCDGIIAPQVRTGEEARSLVRWSLYPPEGERSVGISRAQGYGMNFEEYLGQANDKLVIVAQAEHIEGVRNIKAIAATPGLDAVLTGPYDLSGSLGIPGKIKHPQVEEAISEVKKHCEQAGVSVGIFTTDSDSARAYADEGYNLIALGLDTFFLRDAAKKALKQAKTKG